VEGLTFHLTTASASDGRNMLAVECEGLIVERAAQHQSLFGLVRAG
jgi:hypothetical protein